MSALDESTVEQAGAAKQEAKPQRTIMACNFRSAGRLSNEDARTLKAIHETFALELAAVLDTYLGAAVEVKLETLDQLPVKEHIAAIRPLSYLMPFSGNALIVELENELVFPVVDLLMGGTGSTEAAERELSEIEEEVMRDVITLFARQAEAAWRLDDAPLEPGARMKPALMPQCFAPNQKVAVLRFGLQIAETHGGFNLVIPDECLERLMAQWKHDQPQGKATVWSFPMPPLRERILDCDFDVAAELPSLRVAVRDLIALQPGSVLKLRAPIRNPGMLTAGGRGLFEAIPVRNGTQRAAQLGRRVPSTDWKGR